jgi:hypothetical protein
MCASDQVQGDCGRTVAGGCRMALRRELSHLRRWCAVDGVRGTAGYAAAHRREAVWAMRKPAWALRKRLVALAVAMSALALQACQTILRSGLDLDDEFDRVFLMGGGCPPDTLQKMLREKHHLEMSRALCNRAAGEFVKMVRKNREIGVPPKDYLHSKGGTCTEPAKRHWRCVVERVVTTTYCGSSTGPFATTCAEPVRPSVDRYVLTVEIHDPGAEIRGANFERFAPEKQSRRAD